MVNIEEVKALLNIKESEQDQYLELIIDSVLDFIKKYTNNSFRVFHFDYFYNVEGNKIYNKNLKRFFKEGDLVEIDTILNKGTFKVLNVNDLYLEVDKDLVEEYTSGNFYKVEAPASLKLVVSEIVDHVITKTGKRGLNSEGISRLTLNFSKDLDDDIYRQLQSFSRVGW